jgi:hypothetical protein
MAGDSGGEGGLPQRLDGRRRQVLADHIAPQRIIEPRTLRQRRHRLGREHALQRRARPLSQPPRQEYQETV